MSVRFPLPRKLFLFALILLCASSLLYSQLAPSQAKVHIEPKSRRVTRERVPKGNIQVDVNLVLVPATVTDPIGVPVTGLSSDAFQIFEDGIEQKISYFAAQDAPVALGILFDASRSMEHKLETSRAAISRFLLTAIPEDEFFLIEFNNRPKILCDFTRETSEIEKVLPSIRADGWTSLFDAVHLGITRMRHARNTRKALLILSDGGDNNSRYNEREIRSLVREADTLIYTIGMLGPGLSKRNVKLLSDLAEETGGRYFSAESLEDLPTAVHKISAAIRNQYLVGYLPSNDMPDGRYRKVQLRLIQPPGAPPLRASWRAGYYAQDSR